MKDLLILCFMFFLLPSFGRELEVDVGLSGKPIAAEINVELTVFDRSLSVQIVLERWLIAEGSRKLDISDLKDGEYGLYFSSFGYVEQRRGFRLLNGEIVWGDSPFDVFLRKPIYLTMNYQISKGNPAFLHGANVERTIALTDKTTLPDIECDWTFEQFDGGRAFSPYCAFRFFISRKDGGGFADFPKGVDYSSATNAPPEGYNYFGRVARLGAEMFYRVKGSEPGTWDFVKMRVEEISNNKPEEVEVIYNNPKRDYIILIPQKGVSKQEFTRTVNIIASNVDLKFEYRIGESDRLGVSCILREKNGIRLESQSVPGYRFQPLYGNVCELRERAKGSEAPDH